MKSILNKLNTFGKKLSFGLAAVEIIGLIIYLCYAITYSYYDFATFAGLIIALYSSVNYALLNPAIGIFPLLATASETFALGIFFLNSYPVWADRLNNISMYGSRGTLVPVVINMVFMLLVIIGNIVVAFSSNDKAEKEPQKPLYIFSGATAAVLVVAFAAAGTSTVGTNVRQYNKDTSAIFNTLFSTQKKATSGTSKNDNAIAIDAPTNLTVDADGNYAFTGVEDAAYYLIFLCEPDATGADDSFLFSSGQIANEGAKEYTGKLSDEFDFSYGSYLVKVQAFPEISDAEHKRSDAATANYEASGSLSAPEVEYFWNQFDGTMYFQISNLTTYQFEAYPDRVDITVSNVDDSADTQVITLENISDTNYSAETTSLVRDNTYNITAVASSGNEYVTTPESEQVSVAENLAISDANAITDGFSYSDNFSSDYWTFPRVCENFDLANGGEAGPAKGKYPFDFIYTATPTAAADSSDYTYTLECWFSDKSFAGVLELHSDGTLYLKENGWGPVSPGSVEGIWKDNGDGTATLSYDPSTVLEIK